MQVHRCLFEIFGGYDSKRASWQECLLYLCTEMWIIAVEVLFLKTVLVTL